MTIGIPSHQDVYDIGLAALQSRRPSLIVNPGDITDAYLEGGATMADAVLAATAHNCRAVLLDGAQGDDLHVVMLDRGVTWDQGDEAVGQVTFTRSSDALGNGTIPAGTQVASQPAADGTFATFTTNVDVVFGSTDLGPHTVDVTCTVVGNVGNVADVAVVTRILALSSLWDQSLLCTNAQIFAGGTEPESDQDARDRTRQYPLVLRRGTADALIYGVKTTSGIKRASISVDSGTGVITLYVSDQFGNSNQALANAGQATINGPPAWNAAGDIVNVVGASLFLQDVNYSLVVQAGVDINSLIVGVNAAITAALQRLQPGATLFRDIISTAATNYAPTQIVRCLVNTPAADVAPSVNQVIRAGTVSNS